MRNFILTWNIHPIISWGQGSLLVLTLFLSEEKNRKMNIMNMNWEFTTCHMVLLVIFNTVSGDIWCYAHFTDKTQRKFVIYQGCSSGTFPGKLFFQWTGQPWMSLSEAAERFDHTILMLQLGLPLSLPPLHSFRVATTQVEGVAMIFCAGIVFLIHFPGLHSSLVCLRIISWAIFF